MHITLKLIKIWQIHVHEFIHLSGLKFLKNPREFCKFPFPHKFLFSQYQQEIIVLTLFSLY